MRACASQAALSLVRVRPFIRPSERPSDRPYVRPSVRPTGRPSDRPSYRPFDRPSDRPSVRSSVRPSDRPYDRPSDLLSVRPSVRPSVRSSVPPSVRPSVQKDRVWLIRFDMISAEGGRARAASYIRVADVLVLYKQRRFTNCYILWVNLGYNQVDCILGLGGRRAAGSRANRHA